MFADDTSIHFTHSKPTEFNLKTHTVLETINAWFKNNYPSLHFKKTHYIHFQARNRPSLDLKVGLSNKLIPKALFTKFCGLTVDSTLSGRIHIDHLTTKLSTACYVIRFIKSLMSHKTLLLIYYSLIHTVISYGIIFWGNSCHSIQGMFKKRPNLCHEDFIAHFTSY